MQRFSYSPLTAGSHLVGLAGDFSDWQILPMEDIGGLFVLNLDIPAGSYAYKLIVDGNWMADEACPLSAPDPFGGMHSVLVVEASRQAFSWEDILSHKAHKKALSYLKLYRHGLHEAELRFSWYPRLTDEIRLITMKQSITMERVGSNALFEVFHLFIDENISQDNVLNFYLELHYQGKQHYLGSAGLVSDASDIPLIQLTLDDYQIFKAPAWVGKSVIYQIFPDRFCNGNAKINPNFEEWYYKDCKTPPPEGELLPLNMEYFHLVEDWKDVSGLKQSPYQPAGKPDWWSFYGGDIAGVISKLGYLADLGVDVLYFNPLWQAKSNHKYDSADYKSIDPHFGTPDDMMKLVQLAHERGIKVILDVAFNHTGETFWAFRDTVEKGTQSLYWNWYDWYKWPLPSPLPVDFKPKDYYQCWWGIKDMPDLNFDLSRHHPEENAIRIIDAAVPNMPLVEYIMDTVRWWLLDIGIDGFRLDVPDEVPFWFWELFRKQVKQCKPEAWIVGEIWHDAVKWVNHLYFDSVMNYAYFKNPVTEFYLLHIINQEDFVQKIESGLALYPFHALHSMMNLLGSHDTYRIFELAKGDICAVKMAIVFQMCFLGAPHVYYGDEIGMLGAKDPDNRRPFDWDWESKELSTEIHALYKELIKLRKAYPVFTEGSFAFLTSQEGLISYQRKLGSTSAIVYQNTGETSLPITVSAGMKLVHGSAALPEPAIAPKSSQIYIQASPEVL
jgi:glycosidase